MVARATARWVLPQPGWPRNRIGPVLVDEPQRREVLDEFAVDGGLELVVEVVDGLAEREPRVAQPGSQAPVPGRRWLARRRVGRGTRCGTSPRSWPLRRGWRTPRRPLQLEVAEVGFDLFVEPLTPRPPRSRRRRSSGRRGQGCRRRSRRPRSKRTGPLFSSGSAVWSVTARRCRSRRRSCRPSASATDARR